ncbi:cytochrome P450 72A397-like [Diospyros lotus]|uniref:cytochrome P450 72A397-like n=1 Tax=Diospyros lotus TaxID=55363 RepID=UPI00225095FE|nr:cytochrome P450 72A397-like [Diospyros lotus]
MGISLALVALLMMMGWAWSVVNWIWLKPRRLERTLREQGFHGNPYKLFHGDSKEMITIEKEAQSKPMDISNDIIARALPFHHLSTNCYGKNYFMWIGPLAKINIEDPKLIREVLLNHEVFQKPMSNPLGKLLLKGLLVQEGQSWATHRRIINSAFHPRKLKNMVLAMNQSCREMIRKWEALVSTSGGACELDVWPYFSNLAADVISRTAFGSNYEQGERIFRLQREQAMLAFQVLQSVYIPGSRFLPTKTNRRMKEIHGEVGALLRDVITKRERAIQEGDDHAEDDLLGILLKTNLKEIQEQGNKKQSGLSIEEVIEECKTFYFAGQETTSALITWAMVLLAIHQNWQARARQEVLAVFGDDEPHFDALNQLKLLTMILYEVLRLYSVGPVLIRTTQKTAKLGDYVLPPGVVISIPIIAVHHNPEFWGDDAAEFKPERFGDGVPEAAKSRGTFFPFSRGPRICIGQMFALMEAKLAMAKILRHFLFKLSPSYVHAPCVRAVLQPQYGARLIIEKI